MLLRLKQTFVKAVSLIKLMLIFIRELIKSSLTVAREIVRPQLKLRPGIIALPTVLRTDIELTLYACLITLTPGTLTLEVAPEGDMLYIHCMDIEDAETAIAGMRDAFEQAIMGVTR